MLKGLRSMEHAGFYSGEELIVESFTDGNWVFVRWAKAPPRVCDQACYRHRNCRSFESRHTLAACSIWADNNPAQMTRVHL